jgi:hypothetical protein
MKSIVRKQFLDQFWDSEDLEKSARCWLIIHEKLAKERGIDYTSALKVEIELTGFAKSEGEALRTELERRVSSKFWPRFAVALPDPDTLILTSTEVGLNETPLLTLVLSILSGRLFDGLAVEIRFNLLDAHRLQGKKGSVPTKLIVVAQMRQEHLFVKALFRDFLDDSNHNSHHHQRMSIPDDDLLQRVVQEFLEYDEVADQSLNGLFKSKAMNHLPRWIRWITFVPIDEPRFLPLLFRWVVFSTIFFGTVLIAISPIEFNGLGIVLIIIYIIGLLNLFPFLLFVIIEICLLLYYFRYRRIYRDYFSDLARFALLKSTESEELGFDPMVRKHTSELIALGFSHIGDIARVPVENAKIIVRIFLAPDKIHYFNLACNLVQVEGEPTKSSRIWPVRIVFRAQTIFSSGGRVESVSPSIYSFWLPRMSRDSLFRVTRAMADPIAFFQSHLEASAQFASERELTPVPYRRVDDYLTFRENNIEEERQYFFDHPYSMFNHLRFYLYWPKKESRG